MVNEYFRYIDYGGSLEYYIFELANFSFLVLLLCLCYKLRFININSLIVWSGIFFLPLVLNYFIFSPSLFPDQFQYASEAMSLKSKGISIDNIAAQNEKFSLNLWSISIPTNPITLSTAFLGFVSQSGFKITVDAKKALKIVDLDNNPVQQNNAIITVKGLLKSFGDTILNLNTAPRGEVTKEISTGNKDLNALALMGRGFN